jgi:hypothetical protein
METRDRYGYFTSIGRVAGPVKLISASGSRLAKRRHAPRTSPYSRLRLSLASGALRTVGRLFGTLTVSWPRWDLDRQGFAAKRVEHARCTRRSPRISFRYRGPQLVVLGLEEIDGHQQRPDRLSGIPAARCDSLVGGSLQVIEGGRRWLGCSGRQICSLFVPESQGRVKCVDGGRRRRNRPRSFVLRPSPRTLER